MSPSDQILKGQTALVTGAGVRLGRATALALAGAGVHVVVHYHASRAEAEGTVDKIRELGGDALAIQADLFNAIEAESLIARANDAVGPLDILVNNASIFPENRITDFTLSDLDENIQVNAYAPLQLMRAFAEQTHRGAVVNMLDARMTAYDREHAAYHLSKRMLFSITRMCAVEFAPGIRVNAVAPGLILPPPGYGVEWLERLAHTNPLSAYGSVHDVTEAVLFLLRSEFVTGQVLYIDGGKHLQRNFYGD